MMSEKFLENGFTFLMCGVLTLPSLVLLIICKLFGIEINEYNIYISLIIGVVLIVIALFFHFKEQRETRTLTIIGLDNNSYGKKIKNSLIINIIDDCKILSKNKARTIIPNYIKNIKDTINNYISYKISHFGVASLPFIALAGKYYRKVQINHHYEYQQSDDKIVPLKTKKNATFEQLKCEMKNIESSVALVTIETTSKISNSDLKQFNNVSIFKFYLENPKTNAIIFENQLEKYSEMIADAIYKISKMEVEKIYVIGACQSSLIFEIFRKLNDNRVKEIIICNYSAKSKNRYNWGISIYNEKNIEKYVEFGSDICEKN